MTLKFARNLHESSFEELFLHVVPKLHAHHPMPLFILPVIEVHLVATEQSAHAGCISLGHFYDKPSPVSVCRRRSQLATLYTRSQKRETAAAHLQQHAEEVPPDARAACYELLPPPLQARDTEMSCDCASKRYVNMLRSTKRKREQDAAGRNVQGTGMCQPEIPVPRTVERFSRG